MNLSALVFTLLVVSIRAFAHDVPSPAVAQGRRVWDGAVRARICEEQLLYRNRCAWLGKLSTAGMVYDLLEDASLNDPQVQGVLDGTHFTVPKHLPALLTGPDHAGKTNLILNMESYLACTARPTWSYAMDRTRPLPRIEDFNDRTVRDIETRAAKQPNTFVLLDYEVDVVPHTPYQTLAFLEKLEDLHARYGIKLVVTLSDAELTSMRQTLSDRAFDRLMHSYLRLDLSTLGVVAVPDPLRSLFPGQSWAQIQQLLR